MCLYLYIYVYIILSHIVWATQPKQFGGIYLSLSCLIIFQRVPQHKHLYLHEHLHENPFYENLSRVPQHEAWRVYAAASAAAGVARL